MFDSTSDGPSTLLMRIDSVPGLQGWVQKRESPVCYAPCSADVDANATYYVTGYGVTESSPFAIPEGNPNVSVRTGSAGLTVTGAMFISLGSISFIMGAIATPIAFADAKTSGINGWEAFGLSALVGGAVFILAGIPFLAAGRTRVSLGAMNVAHAARPAARWLPNGVAF